LLGESSGGGRGKEKVLGDKEDQSILYIIIYTKPSKD
jgi:hypothetical protein